MRSVFGLLVLIFSGSLFGAPDPHTAVQEATDDLLQRLVEVQPLYAVDQQKFFDEVESTLAPFVDFIGFSKSVMAKYYRRATAEQRSEFATTFRRQLIEIYAKALVEFDNQKVIVLPPAGPQKDPEKARISLEIHAKDGVVYQVDYHLVLKEDNWKLHNLVINGINIGLQFKSQFKASMQKNRSNIGAVIAGWRVDGK